MDADDEEAALPNATTHFLSSLPTLFAPLCADVCEWLADREVAINVTACLSSNLSGALSAGVAASLPQEVCERLANLSAPLTSCTRCLPRAPTLEDDDVIRAALLVLLAVTSFVGNCYTIHSIRNKASPAPVYKLIMHLSLADVVVSVVCIAGEAVWMLLVQWPFGTAACKIFKFLQMTALHGSSYVVVLIAQNRWVAVNHPLASRRHKSSVCGHLRDTLRCASPRSVLLVWVIGACLSTPQLLMFSVKEGPFYEPYYQCVTYDVSTESERVYNIFNFITLFVIPLLGLIASYLSIYCTLSRSQREIRSVDKISIAMTHDQNRQRSMKRAMVKSRWIAVVIVVAYLVSWLPYYITMLVYFLSPGQWYDSKWMDWIFCFGMANSLVNPAIYGMFQLWKPKRRKQWSCFRHRRFHRRRTRPPRLKGLEGSTQMTHFATQDSFRRHHGASALSLGPSLAPPDARLGAHGAHGTLGVQAARTLRSPGSHEAAAVSPPGSCPTSAPASPLPLTLSAIPDVRQSGRPDRTEATPGGVASETALVLDGNGTATLATLATPRVVVSSDGDVLRDAAPTVVIRAKAGGPFSWRAKFLRKYRALRAHQAHI